MHYIIELNVRNSIIQKIKYPFTKLAWYTYLAQNESQCGRINIIKSPGTSRKAQTVKDSMEGVTDISYQSNKTLNTTFAETELLDRKDDIGFYVKI